jgi:two-component system alkaline phosphatase synthesis response regulator PhoP
VAHETILIVEDEKDIAELVAFNLTKEGFRTRKVESGEKCLALAAATPPASSFWILCFPAWTDAKSVDG